MFPGTPDIAKRWARASESKAGSNLGVYSRGLWRAQLLTGRGGIVKHLDETGALARRIQQRACETYRVAGHHMTIGISISIGIGIGIGIALAPPICFFNAEIETAALERHQLERELPAALEKDEFELFYQPS
jgi:hypothetical protein